LIILLFLLILLVFVGKKDFRVLLSRDIF